MKLEQLLSTRKCFKLVCGAGNEDAEEVEKLVALYAKAGARYFDLSAREDVVLAAQRGLRRVISPNDLENYYLNVSVGIKGDPHVSKALIDVLSCVNCGRCYEVCLHKAVLETDGQYSINATRCIGCGTCIRECDVLAISSYSKNRPLEEVLPPLVKLGIDSIELHAVSDDEEGIAEQWNIIESCFSGILSLCVDRSSLGDRQLISRITRLIDGRKKYSTIIQADGAPMSGCDDFATTTLQALATAQIVQRADLPVFLMLSGGTNSKTTKYAKEFDISAHGVALGSYARMIVREQIDRTDFLENAEVFSQALTTAKALVEKSLSFIVN